MDHMPTPSPCEPRNERGKNYSPQDRFLRAYALTCSVAGASRLARIPQAAHYHWLRGDTTYSYRFQEAQKEAAQRLEDEAIRRAIEGVRTPLLYKGKQVYIQGEPQYRVRYSEGLLGRLLEVFQPGRYGRMEENVLDMDWSKLTAEQLDVIADHLLWRAAAGDRAEAKRMRKAIERDDQAEIERMMKAMGENGLTPESHQP